MEKLLQDLERQLPSMHSEEQAEEALQRSVSTYEVCRVYLTLIPALYDTQCS